MPSLSLPRRLVIYGASAQPPRRWPIIHIYVFFQMHAAPARRPAHDIYCGQSRLSFLSSRRPIMILRRHGRPGDDAYGQGSVIIARHSLALPTPYAQLAAAMDAAYRRSAFRPAMLTLCSATCRPRAGSSLCAWPGIALSVIPLTRHAPHDGARTGDVALIKRPASHFQNNTRVDLHAVSAAARQWHDGAR